MAITSNSSSELCDDERAVAVYSAAARSRAKRNRRIIEILVVLLAAAVGALVLKTFVAQVYSVPSGSMEGTVRTGERVAVEKLSYLTTTPARGDVVVFDGGGLFADPSPGAHVFVKRVIGVGGDTVRCCDVTGRITINGVALDEASYLYPGDAPSDVHFAVGVPPDHLWVMGDHRAASADSRRYIGAPGGGFIPVHRVLGKAISVVWPLSSAHTIGLPGTFAQAGLNQH